MSELVCTSRLTSVPWPRWPAATFGSIPSDITLESGDNRVAREEHQTARLSVLASIWRSRSLILKSCVALLGRRRTPGAWCAYTIRRRVTRAVGVNRLALSRSFGPEPAYRVPSSRIERMRKSRVRRSPPCFITSCSESTAASRYGPPNSGQAE